ncbi:hypothetical protein [Brevibacillus sp. VP]|nr:hypothetical protein [Brevibacillus sp. VP]
MKKFLAITFAVAMIMSVAGVASAAQPDGTCYGCYCNSWGEIVGC